MVVVEALNKHKRAIILALLAILCITFAIMGLKNALDNEFFADSDQETANTKTMKEQYLNPDKELEPSLKETPEGFKTQVIQDTDTAKLLSFIQPDTWEPLDSIFLATSNENITSVKYGNGNDEFVEIAFGSFNENDIQSLILKNSDVKTVGSSNETETNMGPDSPVAPVPASEQANASQNPLFEQIILHGKTTSTNVDNAPLSIPIAGIVTETLVDQQEFEHKQYTIDGGYYFDVFNVVIADGVSVSVVVHHVEGTGTLDQKQVLEMINSFKITDA